MSVLSNAKPNPLWQLRARKPVLWLTLTAMFMAVNIALSSFGIPVPGGALGGLEALLATVQMPSGVPVATVALSSSGPANAAILAAEIVALGDSALRERLRERRRAMREKVLAADRKLRDSIS